MTSANHVVLGLDLSKKSTGFAIGHLDIPGRTISIPRWGQVRPHPAAHASRWMYPVVQSIIKALEAEIESEPWFATRSFTAAIEANIWGEAATEFQYLLGQSVLHWLRGLGVDCVQYAASTVKAWIRRWSTEDLGKIGGVEGKVKIERVWRTEVRPLCPEAFPSSLVVSNDAVDAGFIALFGLYAQAAYLPVGRFDPAGEQALLWSHPDPMRDPFLRGKLFKPVNITPKTELKGSFDNLKSNLHLSVVGKNFFPFRQLDALRDHLRARYAADSKDAMRWCAMRTRGTGKANRDLLELDKQHAERARSAGWPDAPQFECALHSSGQVLITPV